MAIQLQFLWTQFKCAVMWTCGVSTWTFLLWSNFAIRAAFSARGEMYRGILSCSKSSYGWCIPDKIGGATTLQRNGELGSLRNKIWNGTKVVIDDVSKSVRMHRPQSTHIRHVSTVEFLVNRRGRNITETAPLFWQSWWSCLHCRGRTHRWHHKFQSMDNRVLSRMSN